MIPPSLDVTSDLFDAYKALHSNKVHLPCLKVKTYNNIAEYYSHTFLKKGLDSLKSSKHTEKTRERNYEWYYDTLGLSETQRNLIRCAKKKRFRKGKKPVSVATIPGSPLRSEKVTVCKSDFKDYCKRKYRSLNTASAITEAKSVEFQTCPSDSVSELSAMSPEIKTEPFDSTSALQLIKFEPSELPTASHIKTELPAVSHIIKAELPATSDIVKDEFTTTSCAVKAELSDSSNDSFSDDVLIFKMKSNLQKLRELKNIHGLPVSLQIKNERLEISSQKKPLHVDSKYAQDPHQATYYKKFSNISKPVSSSNNQALNSNSNRKSSSAVVNSKSTLSSQVKDSSASLNKQKKSNKKHKIFTNGELKLQKDNKTPKYKKKQRSEKNKNANSNDLDGDQSQKSTTQNNPDKKKCALFKENSSVNDSKSNVQSIKKRRKSALKSQENVLDCIKLSTTIEADSKSRDILPKIKIESLPVVNHCTCKFPCGLSHLCTCGYFASAKEVLSKFKIPRKKK